MGCAKPICECIELSCVSSCDWINTGKRALTTFYEVEYYYPNGSRRREVRGVPKNSIIQVKNKLNEFGLHKFKIINGDECYLFKVNVIPETTCDPCCDDDYPIVFDCILSYEGCELFYNGKPLTYAN